MIEKFIKYFFIILFTFYVYYKLLNLSIRAKYHFLFYLFFSLVFSGVIILFSSNFSYLGLILMVIPFSLTLSLFSGTEFRISLITAILAWGISNSAFVIIAMISSAGFYLFGLDPLSALSYLLLISVIVECIFLFQLFRIKRLKNGMPFLTENTADRTGTIIAIVAVCIIATLINNDGASYIYILSFTLIIVFAAYIIIWWYKWLTKTYLKRKRDADYLALENTLKEKDEYIEKLKQQNSILGKLIHQDNKLIPAMEMAIIKLLKSQINNESTDITETAQKLLEDLKGLSNSRKGILSDIEIEVKRLPTTGISSLDSLFTYLSAKAARAKVAADLTVHGNLKYFIQTMINESDLNTLLAEIIDNSINSASQGTVKRILISIDLIENQYVFQIYDSGDYFKFDVLRYFGLKQITTRTDSGGSGIGLLNIYEIINKYKATIILDETLPSTGIYTKKTSVRFDQKNEYILKSNRNDKTGILSEREDLIVIKGDNTSK
ncbi:MAG: GHKL domain-containing protein [Lachnospiraceae bacterium]